MLRLPKLEDFEVLGDWVTEGVWLLHLLLLVYMALCPAAGITIRLPSFA